MLRHIGLLREIYSFYSSLGHEQTPDKTFPLTQLQFLCFLKDCKGHQHGMTLAQIDRLIKGNIFAFRKIWDNVSLTIKQIFCFLWTQKNWMESVLLLPPFFQESASAILSSQRIIFIAKILSMNFLSFLFNIPKSCFLVTEHIVIFQVLKKSTGSMFFKAPEAEHHSKCKECERYRPS